MQLIARLTVLLILLLAPGAALAATTVHTAVVDAGSGGTRLSFYQVDPGPYPVVTLLFQEKLDSWNGEGFNPDDGIDDYACYTGSDPAAKAFYATKNINRNVMTPLWSGMKEQLQGRAPAVNVKNVIVKVYATAGMRTARENCGEKAVEKLYATIKDGMVAAGLTHAKNEVRTIHGANEEGLWSFISSNDVYRNTFGRPGHPKPRQAPVGILEMGGSSVQVAYPLSPANSDPKALRIKINNRNLAVRAVSYLHLGQTDMRKALREFKNSNNRAIAYKCWANGFDKAFDKGDEGYPKLTRNGAFNPADPDCRNFMRGYLRKHMDKPLDLSQTNVSFVGIGGLKYTLDAFGLLVGPYAGTNNLTTQVDTRCAQDASTWPDINTDAFVQYFCPHGAYVSSLMNDAKFGIFRQNPARFDRALMPTDINNETISWIHGYLLLTYSR